MVSASLTQDMASRWSCGPVAPTTWLRRQLKILPMSPQILIDLTKLLADGASGAAHIAVLLEKDPGVVATVLRVVNSAFYGLPRQLGNLKLAIAYLGTEEIRRLVIAASVMNAFAGVERALLTRIWLHAYLTALIAKELANAHARWLPATELWTLALLHDLGALVALRLDPDAYASRESWRRDELALPEDAEQALDLVPTPILGGLLCSHWNLPVQFETTCVSYRDVGKDPGVEIDDAVRIVGSASLLAHLAIDPLNEDTGQLVKERVEAALGCGEPDFWVAVANARGLKGEAARSVFELLPRRR